MLAGLFRDAAQAVGGFTACDPRRAAALDTLGTLAWRDGRVRYARRLLDGAVEAWHGAERWVDDMRMAGSARSSTFHLRLEARHRGVYPEIVRLRHRKTLAAGRAGSEANLAAIDDDAAALEAALALRRDAFGDREAGAAAIARRLGRPVDGRVLDRFRERPPRAFDDERRLLAAALLAPVLAVS